MSGCTGLALGACGVAWTTDLWGGKGNQTTVIMAMTVANPSLSTHPRPICTHISLGAAW